MKRILYFCLGFLLCMIIIPIASLIKNNTVPKENTQSKIQDISYNAEEIKDKISSDSFRILDTSSNKILDVPDREFCIGALAAEMPVSFESEALKAQTVAIYTYYSKMREESRNDSASEYDFTADVENNTIYITEEKLKSMWGDSFSTYYERLSDCVDDVFGKILVYDDELALTCFYSISAGVTENCEDVFGSKLPYLTAVASPADRLAPEYYSVKTFTADEFKKLVTDAWGDIDLDASPQQWITDIERTNSGTVSQIVIGTAQTTGEQVREIFSLRSANFDVIYSQEEFIFTVRGYGHGVGMSQYGAQYMAQQGASYKEILGTYYPHTVLC